MESLALAIALVVGIIPQPCGVAVETVDSIECNTFFDREGRIVFDQLIFREWSAPDSVFGIKDWRLVKNLKSQTPVRFNGEWVVALQEGETLRYIKSPVLLVSGEDVDPEVVERRWLPSEKRTKLMVPMTKRAAQSRVRGR